MNAQITPKSLLGLSLAPVLHYNGGIATIKTREVQHRSTAAPFRRIRRVCRKPFEELNCRSGSFLLYNFYSLTSVA